MDVTVSPWSYRAALQEQLAASNTPVASLARTTKTTPPHGGRGYRQHGEGVVIENSSLLGNYNDLAEAVAFPQSGGGGGGGRSRSLVMDFIDECVRKGVPESVIVEHVMFMVHAMQEQINLTEALHARFHQDRLRQYEMSELTNTLERQQVYYDEQQHSSHRKKSQECEEANRNLVQSQDREEHVPPWRQVRLNAGLVVGSSAARGCRGYHALTSNNERHAHVAFTQTPLEESSGQQRHGRGGGSGGTAAATFQRFMRPTDASNRKERRKYGAVLEDLHAPPPPPLRSVRAQKLTEAARQGARCRRLAIDKFARRGRQRLVGKLDNAADSRLTWSDDDDNNNNTVPSPKHHGEGQSPGPRLDTQQLAREVTQSDTVLSSLSPPRSETLRARDGIPATRLYAVDTEAEKREEEVAGDLSLWKAGEFPVTVSALAAAPLLSVRTPSFFPSPQLQAYIEQSRRKVREVERVLASTPERGTTRGVW
ncbi:hypothetical protein TraAM80_04994 [Trypanosoma rangeli]|uniref:Uncharacterized protein n=1 Tax=Trypanosoma rangeli TaxID=5698 RepID=A0A3R7MFK7_TRYRA|nr:uncharacterized protein TraAM80_04994 [Trypanosoma rangeli]RNF04925.1 hypothetical protein TraAM80_04994 [Trypanosoma rangeli]|eukprot:RNF04925.1 hypothetical protein TraAM80_04994 [Trypanosoma rangeli]